MKKGLLKLNWSGQLELKPSLLCGKSILTPDYLYGVTAGRHRGRASGLPFAIVCTGMESPALLQKLHRRKYQYTLIDIEINDKGNFMSSKKPSPIGERLHSGLYR